jgi:hypothetical protein
MKVIDEFLHDENFKPKITCMIITQERLRRLYKNQGQLFNNKLQVGVYHLIILINPSSLF